MKHELIITKDGSHTISIPGMKVTYHSVHGAIQESQHVFIKAGLLLLLNNFSETQISILEIGFGTGLNVLLTSIACEDQDITIYYEAIEPYSLKKKEYDLLNYCELLGRNDLKNDFINMHTCEWNKSIVAFDNLLLHKSGTDLQSFRRKSDPPLFHLIYFDAFAPAAQPELWTKEVFERVFSFLNPEGILVTYCSKSEVRRNMMAAGLKVEKLPGPPGKREMIRAYR